TLPGSNHFHSHQSMHATAGSSRAEQSEPLSTPVNIWKARTNIDEAVPADGKWKNAVVETPPSNPHLWLDLALDDEKDYLLKKANEEKAAKEKTAAEKAAAEKAAAE